MPESMLFADIGFVVTSLSGEEKREAEEEDQAAGWTKEHKAHVLMQIERGGGTLIHDPHVYFRGRQRIKQQPSLILLLASRSCRTFKFMMGLSLGMLSL